MKRLPLPPSIASTGCRRAFVIASNTLHRPPNGRRLLSVYRRIAIPSRPHLRVVT